MYQKLLNAMFTSSFKIPTIIFGTKKMKHPLYLKRLNLVKTLIKEIKFFFVTNGILIFLIYTPLI